MNDIKQPAGGHGGKIGHSDHCRVMRQMRQALDIVADVDDDPDADLAQVPDRGFKIERRFLQNTDVDIVKGTLLEPHRHPLTCSHSDLMTQLCKRCPDFQTSQTHACERRGRRTALSENIGWNDKNDVHGTGNGQGFGSKRLMPP